MVVEQEMDEKWEVTESLILSDVLITVSNHHSERPDLCPHIVVGASDGLAAVTRGGGGTRELMSSREAGRSSR